MKISPFVDFNKMTSLFKKAYIPGAVYCFEDGIRKRLSEPFFGEPDYEFNFTTNENLSVYIDEMNRYLRFDRPSASDISSLFLKKNPNSEHPRLLADKELFLKLKLLINSELKDYFSVIKNNADEYLKTPAVFYDIPDGLRLLDTSRELLHRAYTLGLVYKLTDDKKYAECLWDNLNSAGSFPDWNPHHFLDVAEMTAGFSIAYDWLFNYWNNERKSFLEKNIREKGLYEGLKHYRHKEPMDWWVCGTTNWNVVCNGGMVIGGLALDDTKLMGEIVSYALHGLESMMNEFAPDGAWPEGAGYWRYTIKYFVMLIGSLETVLGSDFLFLNAEGVDKTCESLIYAAGPGGLFNFHDASPRVVNSPELLWFSKKQNKPYLGKIRQNMIKDYSLPITPLDILWYSTEISMTDEIKMPYDALYKKVEVAYFRNGFAKNSAYAAIHGGYNKVGHGQLDIGEFIFDNDGVRWFLALGGDDYNLPEYFRSKRYNYYRNRAEGHNTIVINPTSEPDQNPDATGVIIDFQSKDDYGYAVLDMTAAYPDASKNIKRKISLTDKRNTLIIEDEIELVKKSEIYWFAHTEAEIRLSADKKTAILTAENGKKLKVNCNMDCGFRVMDAHPLSTSPQHDSQNKNAGIKKLTIHLENTKSTNIKVVIKSGNRRSILI